MPDSLTEYLRLVQSRREGAEEGVRECDSILDTLSGISCELSHLNEILQHRFNDVRRVLSSPYNTVTNLII